MYLSTFLFLLMAATPGEMGVVVVGVWLGRGLIGLVVAEAGRRGTSFSLSPGKVFNLCTCG